MSNDKHWMLAAGLIATVVMAAPQRVLGQRSDVEVWSANCGRCHTIQPPERYSAKDWASIVTHMSITARLTEAEEDAVMRFLISEARTVGQGAAASAVETRLPSRVVPELSWREALIELEEAYATQCAACHGKNSEGDGPAAVTSSSPNRLGGRGLGTS